MKAYCVNGNFLKLDGGSMFGNAPKTMWSNWIESDEYNRIPLASRSLLIKHDKYNILCETGIGSYLDNGMADRFGVDNKDNMLIRNLKLIGIEESDIDYVIISHMHLDHIGGLISQYGDGDGNWKFYFPNARYIMSLENFTHAEHPHYGDRASFIKGITEGLKNTGQLILINEEKPVEIPDVLNGILEFYFTDGHTPGHLHTLFTGKRDKIFFAGDLIPGIPWVNLPITMGFDRYPEKLINEKKIILDTAIRENWLIVYTHDPVYAASRISKDGKGRYTPVDLSKTFDSHSLD